MLRVADAQHWKACPGCGLMVEKVRTSSARGALPKRLREAGTCSVTRQRRAFKHTHTHTPFAPHPIRNTSSSPPTHNHTCRKQGATTSRAAAAASSATNAAPCTYPASPAATAPCTPRRGAAKATRTAATATATATSTLTATATPSDAVSSCELCLLLPAAPLVFVQQSAGSVNIVACE